MTYAQLKGHFFDIHTAFTRYHKGFYYIWIRYFVAPRILKKKTPIEKPETASNLSMHILCRHGSVVRFLWAMSSFYAVSEVVGSLTIHNDGTLEADEIALIKKLLPHARIIRKEDLEDEAKKTFANYPLILKFFQGGSWQARKLLHPYLSSTRPFMMQYESDILWFRTPLFVAEALKNDFQKPITTRNNEPCPVPFLDGTQLDPHLSMMNSGFMLYHKMDFNLDRLEAYFAKAGMSKNHFIEQGGYASAFGDYEPLPEEKFTIKGTNEEDAVMRHYTGPVRGKYFIRGIPYLVKNHIVNVRD